MSKVKKKGKCKKKQKITLKRKDRINIGRHWIEEYEGNNIVRGYSKKFNIDLLCAVKDLELIGYAVDQYYKSQLEASHLRIKRDKEEKKRKNEEDIVGDSDGMFSFIAGYTSGGCAYGITWDELDSDCEKEEDNYKTRKNELYDSDVWDETKCWGVTIDCDDPDEIPF